MSIESFFSISSNQPLLAPKPPNKEKNPLQPKNPLGSDQEALPLPDNAIQETPKSLAHLQLTPPPLANHPGLTLPLYREFVTTAYTFYLTEKRKPTPNQIYPNNPAKRRVLEGVMATEELSLIHI